MRRLLVYILLVLLPFGVKAQSGVMVKAELDSMMMWIGQQTGLHVEVTCNRGRKVEFPAYRDTIVRGLEIIPPVTTDTAFVNDGQTMTVTRNYVVTCFDSALIYIPYIPVTVDGSEYQSNRLALAFMTYDIPEEEQNKLFPPKDNLRTPIRLYEIKGVAVRWLLAAIGLTVGILLLMSFYNNKPIIKRIKVEAKVPAHVRAMDGIEELRISGGARSEDAKEYYTRLTDLVREYINERFGFNATEMTSDEILEHLLESCSKESLKELSELFSTSDMAKFAKFKPLLGENDRNLVTALDFVKDTMVEVPEEELQPKEIETVVEVKRSRGARVAILAGGIILTLAGAVFLILTVIGTYNLI